MLLTISFASAINTNTTDFEQKESPLYKIRTKRAIGEKITNIVENFRTKFLGERIYFLPPQFQRKTTSWTTTDGLTIMGCPSCSIFDCK